MGTTLDVCVQKSKFSSRTNAIVENHGVCEPKSHRLNCYLQNIKSTTTNRSRQSTTMDTVKLKMDRMKAPNQEQNYAF